MNSSECVIYLVVVLFTFSQFLVCLHFLAQQIARLAQQNERASEREKMSTCNVWRRWEMVGDTRVELGGANVSCW